MIYTNANIFHGGRFKKGSFAVSGGRFKNVLKGAHGEDSVDLEGMYVIPGLVDIHTHGSYGYDFSDGDLNGLHKIGGYLAQHGITSFTPTSMTLPYDRLERTFLTAKAYHEECPSDSAKAAGIHMEGPFLSAVKKGAQNENYLSLPDINALTSLNESCGGLIRIVDIAPELNGAFDFIREVKNMYPDICISVAHTSADYDTAKEAFDLGASHVTHLFNAMPVLHHRGPGVIGAAFDNNDVAAELICDGLHVHPSAIRMAFSLFRGRICLISDSIRCCGMPDGEYELGGQQVTLRNGQVRCEDGTLAGAASDLYSNMVNAVRCGIPVNEAVIAATLTPAKEIGMDEKIGSIDTDKAADFIVCDKDLDIRQVYIDGVRIR